MGFTMKGRLPVKMSMMRMDMTVKNVKNYLMKYWRLWTAEAYPDRVQEEDHSRPSQAHDDGAMDRRGEMGQHRGETERHHREVVK